MNAPAANARGAARAAAQRGRILDAARQCFIEQGFHAATMASIAATAGMSAGLIYRYFESKNAIVLAIIERQIDERRERIAALHTCTDLAAALVEAFQDVQSRRPGMANAALFLEMSAEATRVPQIAQALRDTDRRSRADFEAWLARPAQAGGRGLPAAEARARALLVQCLFEGLVVRAAREPDLEGARLREALEPVVAQLLAAR